MAKAKTLPPNYKRAAVALVTYDKAKDTTTIVTKDGKRWTTKDDKVWTDVSTPPAEPMPDKDLPNRQAALADEGVAPPLQTGGPGGHAERTMSEADIKSAEAALGKTVEGGISVEQHAAVVADKDARIKSLESELAAKDMELGAHRRGKHEGGKAAKAADDMPAAAEGPMGSGQYHNDISKIPTVDEINAANGQPESSPKPEDTGQRPL